MHQINIIFSRGVSMERVVNIQGASFYVVYRLKGERAIVYGIACALDLVLYKNGLPVSLSQFEKILLDEATTLTLEADSTESLETILSKEIERLCKQSSRTLSVSKSLFW